MFQMLIRRSLSTATTPLLARSGTVSEDLIAFWRQVLFSPSSTQQQQTHVVDKIIDRLIEPQLRKGRSNSTIPDSLHQTLRQYYLHLPQHRKPELFTLLTTKYGIDAAAITTAIQKWNTHFDTTTTTTLPAESSSSVVHTLAENLNQASQPLYSKLWAPLASHSQSTTDDGGVAFLLQLRADILSHLHHSGTSGGSSVESSTTNTTSGDNNELSSNSTPSTNTNSTSSNDTLPRAQTTPSMSKTTELRCLSESLRRTLCTTFNTNLLQLHQLSWSHTSAALLEKIATGEKVHRVTSLHDLKRRLDSDDRRMFAFIHPSLPQEPLVVLSVALAHNIPATKRQILGRRSLLKNRAAMLHHSLKNDSVVHSFNTTIQSNTPGVSIPSESESQIVEVPQEYSNNQYHTTIPTTTVHVVPSSSLSSPPSTAVFYSISSLQPGLSGIDLGTNLIKAAAKQLLAEFPSIQALVTLSPLPGFARWLQVEIAQRLALADQTNNTTTTTTTPTPLLTPYHYRALKAHLTHILDYTITTDPSQQPPEQPEQKHYYDEQQEGHEKVKQEEESIPAVVDQAHLLQLALHHSHWLKDPQLDALLKPPMLKLAARYLLVEKRRGLALNPVAHFHFKNGAILHRIHWKADLSVDGLDLSHGIMVNYRYDLNAAVENSHRYLERGEIAAPQAVKALLKD